MTLWAFSAGHHQHQPTTTKREEITKQLLNNKTDRHTHNNNNTTHTKNHYSSLLTSIWWRVGLPKGDVKLNKMTGHKWGKRLLKEKKNKNMRRIKRKRKKQKTPFPIFFFFPIGEKQEHMSNTDTCSYGQLYITFVSNPTVIHNVSCKRGRNEDEGEREKKRDTNQPAVNEYCPIN